MKPVGIRQRSRRTPDNSVAVSAVSMSSTTRLAAAKALRVLNEIDHMCRGVGRQLVLDEARPRRYACRHLTGLLGSPVRCRCEERDNQVLKSDDTDMERLEFGIPHPWKGWLPIGWVRCGLHAVGFRPLVIVPPEERLLMLQRVAHKVGSTVGHIVVTFSEALRRTQPSGLH
jgi:hypothetical protein